MDLKVTTIICPKCNKGEFKMIGGKEVCSVCGEPITDDIIKNELDKAWDTYQMLKGGDFNKFTVFKNEDIEKYISKLSKDFLENAKVLIEAGRLKDGKNIGNTYLVINTDEPYAPEIIEILKKNKHWG